MVYAVHLNFYDRSQPVGCRKDEIMENTTTKSEYLINIGVIGMGNCGGQMADKACGELGIDAIAINASTKDLGMLQSDEIMAITIGDGKGTGKNRETAAEFLLNQITMLHDNAIEQFIEQHDAIFIVSSMGGGFGSGSSLVLADVLSKMTDGGKVIIPVGVMPFESEGYTAQDHAVDWMREVVYEMEMPYIIYDNSKFLATKGVEASQRLVNEEFVMNLRAIRGDFAFNTTSGGIDNRDMLTAISVPGRIVTATTFFSDPSQLIDESITKTMEKYIRESSAHAALADDKAIKVSAYMFGLNSDFKPYTTNLKTEAQEIFGAHINDYDNFSFNHDDDGVNVVSIILSGLSVPALRVNKLIGLRDQLETEIAKKEEEQNTNRAKSKLAASSSKGKLKINAKKFASENVGTPKKNTSDFLADYMAKRTGQ